MCSVSDLQILPKNRHVTSFDSLAELRDVEPNRKLNKTCSSDRPPEPGWWGPGIKSKEDVNRNLDGGWVEGAEKMIQSNKELDLSLRVSRPRRKRVRAAMGDTLDMQRVWQGDLARAWSATEMGETMLPLKHVCIAVELNGSGYRTGEDFLWRGAAALALADLISESGRMVKIMVYGVTAEAYADKKAHVYTVKVKDYTEPLDVERLAASACMAGTYRHAVWRVREARTDSKVGSGYGYSLHGKWKNLPNIEPDNEHVVWANDLWSSSAAREWVMENVAKLKEVTDG